MTFQIERADMGQASPQRYGRRSTTQRAGGGVQWSLEHPRPPHFRLPPRKHASVLEAIPRGSSTKVKTRTAKVGTKVEGIQKLTVLGLRNSTQRWATMFNLNFVTSLLTVSSTFSFHQYRHIDLAGQGLVPDSYVLHIAQLSRNVET